MRAIARHLALAALCAGLATSAWAAPELDYERADTLGKLVQCAAVNLALADATYESISKGGSEINMPAIESADIFGAQSLLLSAIFQTLAARATEPARARQAVIELSKRLASAPSAKGQRREWVAFAASKCFPAVEQRKKAGAISQEDFDALKARVEPVARSRLEEALAQWIAAAKARDPAPSEAEGAPADPQRPNS